MSVLFLLIPLSIVMATFGLVACIWSIRSGQYSHLEEDRWKAVLDTSFEKTKPTK